VWDVYNRDRWEGNRGVGNTPGKVRLRWEGLG